MIVPLENSVFPARNGQKITIFVHIRTGRVILGPRGAGRLGHLAGPLDWQSGFGAAFLYVKNASGGHVEWPLKKGGHGQTTRGQRGRCLESRGPRFIRCRLVPTPNSEATALRSAGFFREFARAGFAFI